MLERLQAAAIDPRSSWLLVGLGVLLRLVHLLHGCSLSVDESLLALNVFGRSPAELLEPLGDNQGAPLVYLLLLEAVVALFGESELALRLIAFVSGVVSLFLFRSLALRYLTPVAVPIAIGLFAVSGNLIFYSAQVKQYSSDVMLALVLLLLADRLRAGDRRWWDVPSFGLAGAVALWSSHPAVFVLAGLAASLGWFRVVRAGRERRPALLVAFAIWAVAFLAIWWISLRQLADQAWLHDFWDDEFMPFPPTSLNDLRWLVTAFFQMFSKMLGFSLAGLGGLTALVGLHALYSADRERAAQLVLPILLTLAASGLELYPFCCRLILFAAPALVLLMAEGAATVLCVARGRAAIGATLVALLFLHPLMWAGYHVVHPRYEEEIGPHLDRLRQHRQAGDVIYLYYGAKPAFSYYARRHGWDVADCCILGARSRKDWSGYERDLQQLRGSPRVWIVFSHVYDWKSVDERVLFLHYLDRIGRRLEGFETEGAALYLYDLSRAPEP